MNTAIVERDSRHIDNASVPDSLPEREEQNACFEVVMPPIQTSRAYLFVKRSFDVVMSLAALLILAMPMALIALLIRLDSPGPAFFRQER